MKVEEPKRGTRGGDRCKDRQFVVLEPSQQHLEGASEEIAACADRGGPHQCAHGIEGDESARRNPADAERKGHHRSKPVEKTKPQNERRVKAPDQGLGLLEPGCPLGPPSQQGRAVPPAQIKKELVSAHAAGEGRQDDAGQLEVPAVRGESAHDQDGFALEKGAQQNGPVPVLLNE